MVGPPYDADNMYGWAKLMTGDDAAVLPRATSASSPPPAGSSPSYGERGVENHAVIAMIARAFVRQNPFEVWGDGTQIRNWTYVGDIVERDGARRREDRGRHGRQSRHRGAHARDRRRPRGAARTPARRPRSSSCPHMPTGPLNRVCEQPPRPGSSSAGSRRMNVHATASIGRRSSWYFGSRGARGGGARLRATARPEQVRPNFGGARVPD